MGYQSHRGAGRHPSSSDMIAYTAYQFLGFILPGALVLFASVYGSTGWPRSEPAASGLVGVLATSFVAGHAVAAVAGWLEPLAWGSRPGRRVESMTGLFGTKGYFDELERPVIEERLRTLFGSELQPQTCFDLAYTRLQQQGKDSVVQLMNQEIGFHRNMASASIASFFVTVGVAVAGRGDHLRPDVWLPTFGVAALLFVFRYRRFWRRFAHNVVRGVLAEGQPPR